MKKGRISPGGVRSECDVRIVALLQREKQYCASERSWSIVRRLHVRSMESSRKPERTAKYFFLGKKQTTFF